MNTVFVEDFYFDKNRVRDASFSSENRDQAAFSHPHGEKHGGKLRSEGDPENCGKLRFIDVKFQLNPWDSAVFGG